MAFASVIVSTFNRPEALNLVLLALLDQDCKNFEIIIADDGSDNKTKKLIKLFQAQKKILVKHAWQPHRGFRAAKSRNNAAAISQGEYLIFLDGDTIPQRSFVRMHLELAEKKFLVAGNRILLSPSFTKKVFAQNKLLHRWSFWRWLLARCLRSANRLLPILFLGKFYPRYLRRKQWRGVKTCNLGVWRKDFAKVNGFDESFRGWGYEDSDLVIRLMKKGVLRKDGHFAIPVFHLWHPTNNRKRARINYNRAIR